MTNNEERINKLSRQIDNSILPLITSDYVFWGLPYYINPGDTLIWEGALEMLKSCKYKCLHTCGWDEYRYIPLKKDTVILIIGGGFFGDLWRNAWEQVIDTIIQYPDNPIVILPQSIHYQSEEVAIQDALRLAHCKKLTICTRDEQSYRYARKNFLNATTLLVPDMAFHVNLCKLKKWCVEETNKSLYLKRTDKEFPAGKADINGMNVDVRDWPAMSDSLSLTMRIVCRLHSAFQNRLGGCLTSLVEPLMYYGHRNVVIKDAVRFISEYKTVYTTRLHVMILSFLLGKKVYIMDNSYGKISGCYNAWLKDCDNIQIYEE